jgi:arylsulfotransferase ASST
VTRSRPRGAPKLAAVRSRTGLGGRAACAAAAVAALAPAQALAAVHITAKPGLKPSFKTGITDYVSKCSAGKPLQLTIDAGGDTVSVDSAPPRSGSFTKSVALKGGQATELVVRSGGNTTRHHVRCLTSSFPYWKFERPGTPRAQWYLFAPSTSDGRGPYNDYVIIMNGRGVPVWWRRATPSPFNSLLLPNGDVGWTRWYGDPFGMRDSSAWELRRLDGTLVRTLKTPGTPTDTHDMQPLPNGNFLLITYRLRAPVNLAPWGVSGNGGVFDGEIDEIDPTGTVVWAWSSKDHVEPSETTTHPPPARGRPDGRQGFDVFHLNSVALDAQGGLVISARHTDSLYRIERPSGTISWKLGGTKTPESLKIIGDPKSPSLAKQHDARVLPDGTITVYDNRSKVSSPRAVRFRVDAAAGTARWLEQVTEPKVHSSGAEGSAGKIAGDDWVVSWGGSHLISETTASGRLVWRLSFNNDVINYRVTPIPAGRLSASALRRAMDLQYPRH